MSELGLGLAALGRPAYINLGHGEDVADATVDGMERAAHAVLDRAYERGVRRFDAARSYGLAERFLASWLRARGLGRDDVFVSSKWGYAYTGGWRIDAEAHEVKELSGAQLRRQWAETQDLLGPWLRLYQIHSATAESGVLDDTDVRAGLEAVRAAGVRIGLSATGTGQAATIDRALEAGGFDEVQATWNLHERSAEGALARAAEAGLEVYVKEAVANGRLAARGAPPALRRRGAGAGHDAGRGRARGGAGTAVGDGGAQRRLDGRAARVQPRGAGGGVGGRAGGAARAGRRVLGDAVGAALELGDERQHRLGRKRVRRPRFAR